MHDGPILLLLLQDARPPSHAVWRRRPRNRASGPDVYEWIRDVSRGDGDSYMGAGRYCVDSLDGPAVIECVFLLLKHADRVVPYEPSMGTVPRRSLRDGLLSELPARYRGGARCAALAGFLAAAVLDFASHPSAR